MRVLILPTNISSISTSTVDALNKLPGVEAKSIIINRFIHQTKEGENCYFFESVSRRKRPIKWIFQQVERYFLFRRLVKWANIIHWVYDDIGLKKNEIKLLSRVRKPAVIEWVGSDIRNPEILFNLNSYYKKAFEEGYEYANYESDKVSNANQIKFKKLGAKPLVNPEIDLFVNKELFPIRYFIWPRMCLKAYADTPPEPSKKRPLILHSPTAKIAKGTDFITKAVDELKSEFDFDFLLLHGMERTEVLSYMEKCDVFIDQVILGMYGLATCEAMCFGKPVMCYLMPAVIQNGLPEECPIVNTSVEEIKSNLRLLLKDSELRYELGLKSRKYAEKYFDSYKNSERLVEIYKQVIYNQLADSGRD